MFKQNEFIQIEYTATIKETSQVIETTDEATAKENHLFNENQKYGPKTICIGQHQVFPALEEELKNKELNKDYEIILPPEKAFGKKNAKLFQLMSTSYFKKENINPYPGLAVNIDDSIGIVRTASPGRVIVDFNHPFAGRNVLFKIKILKTITGDKEKIESLTSFYLNNFKVEIKESQANITADLSEKIKKDLTKKILDLIPTIKKINITKE